MKVVGSGRNPSALLRLALLACIVLLVSFAPIRAKEHALFQVDAIPVDETAADATQAKMKAILGAQRKAFLKLVRRLAGPGAEKRLAKLSDRDIGRLLSSLSIADEHTGPTRYIAKITVRFNPSKVLQLLRARGIAFVTRQSPPVLVVPVWEGPDGPVLWEDNPWLKAWRKLADEHALVPVVIPEGDDVDRNTLTPQEAMDGDKAALQALQMRYDKDHVLVAIARPQGENAIQAAMIGKSPGGRIAFDKTYTAPEGQGLAAAAEQAVRRFIDVMTQKWRNKVLKQARDARLRRQQARAAHRMTVIVPFSSLREWQVLRARLATTPGVSGVDVQSLSGTHAVVRLATTLSPDALRAALARSGLDLRSNGGRWYLRAW